MEWPPAYPWGKVAKSEWALVTSASKSFNIPALTGAYALISDPSTQERYLTQLKNSDGLSSPAVLALIAHIAAYQEGQPWLTELKTYLQQKSAPYCGSDQYRISALNWQIPQSTYLAWIDLRPLNVDDNALQRYLIEHEKVAIMPGSTYGHESSGFVRLNAGCPRSKLDAGLTGLINALHATLIN